MTVSATTIKQHFYIYAFDCWAGRDWGATPTKKKCQFHAKVFPILLVLMNKLYIHVLCSVLRPTGENINSIFAFVFTLECLGFEYWSSNSLGTEPGSIDLERKLVSRVLTKPPHLPFVKHKHMGINPKIIEVNVFHAGMKIANLLEVIKESIGFRLISK